jgi:LysM repeat protein
MKRNEKKAMGLGLAILFLMTGGCAAKKMDVTEAPMAAEVAAPTPTEAPAAAPVEKYVVQKGDTLWAISDHDGAYADSTQWPLLFKTNRDQITDPDQISPGQVLIIQKGQSLDEIQHAKQLAKDTPAFKAHVEPRSPLPLDYF